MTTVVTLLVALTTGLAEASPADGDEISRSRGRRGGAVVLAARVVPELEGPDATLDALSGQLQARLRALAEQVVDPGRIDVRPAPQRVCPQVGCRAVSVGVMLAHQEGGCAAVAVVGPPGETNRTLVPWAGGVQLANDQIPFRTQPETRAIIQEFVPCTELLDRLDDGPVVEALAAAAAQ